MATTVFYATTTVTSNPVGGDTPWVQDNEAEGPNDSTGAYAELDYLDAFSEELLASFTTSGLSIKTVNSVKLRILKSYSDPNPIDGVTPEPPNDNEVYMQISGVYGNNVADANPWPSNDYVAYDDASSPSTYWGFSASSIRTALKNNTLQFDIRAYNGFFDTAPIGGPVRAFVYEFELTVDYIPAGAPQMTLMGVGM